MWLLLVCLSFSFLRTSVCQQLFHRYSFNDGTASDSVGTAHGTLTNGAYVSTGWLRLDQLSSGPHLRLPTGLLGTYTDITIELWFSASTLNSDYIKIFQFGDPTSNCPNIGCNQNYGASSTWTISCSICGASFNPYKQVSTTTSYHGPTNVHLVAVYSTTSNALRLYVNGALVGSNTLDVSIPGRGSSDFLGLGKSPVDPYMIGSIDEFRIWKGELPASAVSAHFTAGSNSIPGGNNVFTRKYVSLLIY
jgi:hypothetical protein